MGRLTSIDPAKLLVGTLPLKVIWNTDVVLYMVRPIGDSHIKVAVVLIVPFRS